MTAAGARQRGDGPLLCLHEVTKRYGPQIALNEVSLAIDPGRFTVLLGPSGSGKTTMLRCVAGIERVDGGTIELGGRSVDDGRRQLPPEQRDLAMVFQDYALWPHMTAQQNVAYALRRRRLPASEAVRRTRAMLERVGLGLLTERYPSQLSGGEQQRVALARALVSSPRLLLFDEPLSNLDANLRERMRVEIATLVRDAATTALYITHDQSEAFALADAIGVMQGGRLIQLDSPEAVYAAPATPFVARLTGLAADLAGQVQTIDRHGRAWVTVGSARLEGVARDDLLPGADVQVLLRPAALRLLPGDSDAGQLRGVVRDVAFIGRGYDHVVEVAGGTRVTGVFDERRWERGQQVGLLVDAAGCLFFRREVATEPTVVLTPL